MRPIATARQPGAQNNGTGTGSQPSVKDPYLGLNFWIQLGQINIAGFQECSPLTIETEVFEYAEGGLNSYKHKLPVRQKYSNITLKRGIDDGHDLFQWYQSSLRHEILRQDISIVVYGQAKEELWRWDLMDAYPVKWTGPDLKAQAGALAVESVEFAHSGIIPAGDPRAARLHQLYQQSRNVRQREANNANSFLRTNRNQ